jgi:hypothetical protein
MRRVIEMRLEQNSVASIADELAICKRRVYGLQTGARKKLRKIVDRLLQGRARK